MPVSFENPNLAKASNQERTYGAKVKENKNNERLNEAKRDVVEDDFNHEAEIGKGLLGALDLLRDRGGLKENNECSGRDMDKKKSRKFDDISEKIEGREIFIERKDEFGRVMTQKEAFRKLSHSFHGKGPGKKKQGKRLKQYQQELNSKPMQISDTVAKTVERMKEAQAATKSPYIVLSKRFLDFTFQWK